MNKRTDDGRGGGRGAAGGGRGGGDRGGGRGGPGRGTARGGGPPAARGGGAAGRSSPADYTCVINQVEFDVGPHLKFDLWTLAAKTGQDKEFVNPSNVTFRPGTERFGKRIMKKELNRFLTDQFGEFMYAYDEAAMVMVSPGAAMPRITTFQWQLGRDDKDPQFIDVELSKAVTKIIQHANEIELRYNQVINTSFAQELLASNGEIHRKGGGKSCFYPSLSSPLGQALDNLIDRADKKNLRDIELLDPFVVRRGFEAQAHFVVNPAANPPAKSLANLAAPDMLTEFHRGAYRGFITVVIKTGCFFPNDRPLIDVLSQNKRYTFTLPGKEQGPGARLSDPSNQAVLHGLVVRKNKAAYSKQAVEGGRLKFDNNLYIDKIIPQTARTFKFEKDGKEVSVFEYMQTQYGMTLKYPDLPLVQLKVQQGQRQESIPAELLTVCTQVVSTFGNKLQNNFTNVSRISTDRFKQSLTFVFSLIGNTNSAANKILSNWGIKLKSVNALQHPGYLCIDPVVQYKEGVVPVQNGRWNMRSATLATSVPLGGKKVLFVDLGTEFTSQKRQSNAVNEFQGFAVKMVDQLSTLYGTKFDVRQIARPVPYSAIEHLMTPSARAAVRDCSPRDLAAYHNQFTGALEKAILAALGIQNPTDIQKHVAFAFVVLPPQSFTTEFVDSRYNMIKIFFNETHGVSSQCCRPDKTPLLRTLGNREEDENGIRQHFSALICGANIKGGCNNFIVQSDLLKKISNPSTALLGVDLQHSHVPGRGKVSICGAVLSATPTFNRYVAGCSVQPFTDDIVGDMRTVFKNVLERRKVLQASMGKAEPLKDIFYYRDGVDHGSHRQVIIREVQVLEKVCEEMFGNKPNVTVIICLKRHNARLFPTVTSSDKNGNPNNVPPGTIVGVAPPGKAIAATGPIPNEDTFYIMGHEAIPGSTAVPLRISIIQNSNSSKLTSWEIATLTFAVHHGDQVVTKSVSLPAPVLYAHKLCEHTKAILDYKEKMLTQPKELAELSHEADAYAAKMVNLAFL